MRRTNSILVLVAVVAAVWPIPETGHADEGAVGEESPTPVVPVKRIAEGTASSIRASSESSPRVSSMAAMSASDGPMCR